MVLKYCTVKHKDKDIEVCVSMPDTSGKQCGIMLTHGAGGDMNTFQLKAITANLVVEGYTVIRFTCKSLNIVYRKRVYNTVLEWVFKEKEVFHIHSCYIGGRSMGSRAAVVCCNEVTHNPLQEFIKGVICLAYPLYPPQQPTNLRSQPIIDLTIPGLFLSGTLDNMAKPQLLKDVLQQSKGKHRVHWISGGDHSHTVKGRTAEEVCTELSTGICKWITECSDKKLSAVSPISVRVASGDRVNKNSTDEQISTRKRKERPEAKSVKRRKTKN